MNFLSIARKQRESCTVAYLVQAVNDEYDGSFCRDRRSLQPRWEYADLTDF